MFNSFFDRQCPSATTPYTIQRGDILYAIANRFNTTVQQILATNPGINPERLYVGQVLCIPQVQPEQTTCPIGTVPYEIKSGDTLYSIAKRFNTTVQEIMTSNPDIVPERLSVGQVICVTEGNPLKPVCPSYNYYVIPKGVTLSTIARIYDISIQALLDSNPGIDPNKLYEGQIICIPMAPSPVRIIISTAAKWLSLYRQGIFVKSYPVATGKPETPTPLGIFTIVNKQVNPGGPFGTRWMGLSKPHYGIHGTNNPSSIGLAASNGCIRMQNEDVNELFNVVSVGTIVSIY